MVIRGNKGEWSELYVLLKVLYDEKLTYTTKINGIKSVTTVFNVLGAKRVDSGGDEVTYNIQKNGVEVLSGGGEVTIPKREIGYYINMLKNRIPSITSKSNTIPEIQGLLKNLNIKKLSSNDTKSDITLKVIDQNTPIQRVLGFSIKSQMGSPASLLNAGKSTNFEYKLNSKLTGKEKRSFTIKELKNRYY